VVMKEYSYTSTPPMGLTACTEPHCLYKGNLYLYPCLHMKYRHFCQILIKLQFYPLFFNIQMSNFVKIPPVEADCSIRTDGRTDRRTDITKLEVASRNTHIANETNKSLIWVRSGKLMLRDLPNNACGKWTKRHISVLYGGLY